MKNKSLHAAVLRVPVGESPSPGTIASNRVLMMGTKLVYATGNSVFRASSVPPAPRDIPASKNPHPLSTDWKMEISALPQYTLPSEIQSISSAPVPGTANTVLGACTGEGVAVVGIVGEDGSLGDKYTITHPTNTSKMVYWGGLAHHPHDPLGSVALALSSGTLSQYVEGREVRTVSTAQAPLAIQQADCPQSQAPLVVLTENNTVSVWDFRVAESNGCVQRFAPHFSRSPIYGLDVQGNRIAMGGAGRVVYCYDTRKWTCRGKWPNCTKYEVTHVKLSSIDESMVYVGGLGNELVCGSWKGEKGDYFSYLVDGRWLGLTADPQGETLAGMTDTGHLYFTYMNNLK